jgi:hypothetical protein
VLTSISSATLSLTADRDSPCRSAFRLDLAFLALSSALYFALHWFDWLRFVVLTPSRLPAGFPVEARLPCHRSTASSPLQKSNNLAAERTGILLQKERY